MTYQEAMQAAKASTTYHDADAVLKAIEGEYDTISDRQYYSVRNTAYNAVERAQDNA